ncbi:hypothetical protein ACEQ8H_003955 [Pleosporales sp. CAS-2024a]
MSDEYPRPDFVRENVQWQSLDGPWSFLFDDNPVGSSECWHMKGLPNEVTIHSAKTDGSEEPGGPDIVAKMAAGTQELLQNNRFPESEIQVPYVFQCRASGINEKGVHQVLWYEREIEDLRCREDKLSGHRVIIRFGAVDYEAKVREGKQYWKAQPESIFYTPSGGIWQSVWLESVPKTRIGDASTGTVLRSNDIEDGKLVGTVQGLGRPCGQAFSIDLEVSLGVITVSRTEKKELPHDLDIVDISTSMRLSSDQQEKAVQSAHGHVSDEACWNSGVALWSPEHPTLYDITIRLYDDASSSTLIDTVHTTTGMRSLSWSHGDGTFRLNKQPSFQALILDQGYWPDTCMTQPSSWALRTDIQRSKTMAFNGSVMRDINSPQPLGLDPHQRELGLPLLLPYSLPQRTHIRALYYPTKTMRSHQARKIDNCAWKHVKTDLSTFHDYRVWGHQYRGVDGQQRDWGYTTATDAHNLLSRMETMMMGIVSMEVIFAALSRYTQLTDMEQEVDGLYTPDRKEKLDSTQVRKIIERAKQKYAAMRL